MAKSNEPIKLSWPADTRSRLYLIFLGLVVVIGGYGFGMKATDRGLEILFNYYASHTQPKAAFGGIQGAHGGIPISKLPGPARAEELVFVLDDANAEQMIGTNDRGKERWSDVAGNYYNNAFAEAFSYTDPAGAQVRVQYERRGTTLEGRLEAQGMKPNFAYQIKLMGDFAKREQFETIGRIGRWRLPGESTNYTDEAYFAAPESTKREAEAYILFDFFITDSDGNAVREFSLDSTLHVLWNAQRQRSNGVPVEDAIDTVVFAENPAYYTRLKERGTVESIWAERERQRYAAADELIRLPPGTYQATLALTEESFHAIDRDGGSWATVMHLPIAFEIDP